MPAPIFNNEEDFNDFYAGHDDNQFGVDTDDTLNEFRDEIAAIEVVLESLTSDDDDLKKKLREKISQLEGTYYERKAEKGYW